MYSMDQKNRILFESDLVDPPLGSDEVAQLSAACDNSDGDLEAACDLLPETLSNRVRDRLNQGVRFSIELDRLRQRGVAVVFAEEGFSQEVSQVFVDAPALLFVSGARRLLRDEAAPVFTSLPSFASSGCAGVLVADRPFEALLRDNRVLEGLEASRALVVSDRYRAAAGIRPDAVDGSASRGAAASRSVFLSGSRGQVEIPRNVQDSIDKITGQGMRVLIGDSDKGVDRQVADMLKLQPYPFVTVYTIGPAPRIDPDSSWEVRVIEADPSLKPQQRQMVKDRAMADAADYGLAVLRPISKNRHGALQVSSGTLRNAVQMLLSGKRVKLFYLYEGEMRTCSLKTIEQLEAVLASYGEERLGRTETTTILSARGVSPEADAAQVKREKLLRKYGELLKNERKRLGGTKAAAGGASVAADEHLVGDGLQGQSQLALF